MARKLIGLILSICLFVGLPSLAYAEDFEKNFLQRYWRLIDSKTEKEFRELQADKQRWAFINNFWKVRDPNKDTPENEFKIEYDKRISEVAGEFLLGDPLLKNFLFRNSGGLNGDPAWAYLLKGYPKIRAYHSGQYLVDMMVWVYVDPRGGANMFLFYRDLRSGQFKLFKHNEGTKYDDEDILSKLYFLSSYPQASSDPDYLSNAQHELLVSEFGDLFIYALNRYSTYQSGRLPEEDLRPPTSEEITKKITYSNIVGLPPKFSDGKTLFSKNLNSMFRAIFQISNGNDGKIASNVYLIPSDVDWIYFNDLEDNRIEKIQAYIWIKMSFIDTVDGKTYRYQNFVWLKTLPITAQNSQLFSIRISELDNKTDYDFPNGIRNLSELPTGNYRVSIYMRNVYTMKYFADVINFTRQ